MAIIVSLILGIVSFLPLNADQDYSESIASTPVLYHGRIRPFEVAARLWFKEIYNDSTVLQEHRAAFKTKSGVAYDVLSRMQFSGTDALRNAPLFYIGYLPLINKLKLEKHRRRFSVEEIEAKLYRADDRNQDFMKEVLIYLFAKKYFEAHKKISAFSLNEIHPELTLAIKGDSLVIAKMPQQAPLISSFRAKEVIASVSTLKDSLQNKKVVEEFFKLVSQFAQVKEISKSAPWKIIPTKHLKGDWLDLNALEGEINQTLYSDVTYEHLRQVYRSKDHEKRRVSLLALLNKEYRENNLHRQDTIYHYPSPLQLEVEQFYYRYPLILFTLLLYGFGLLALVLFFMSKKPKLEYLALTFLVLALLFHTVIIGLRCYILERPPVSNMFETVVYVPWISVITGFVFWILYKNYSILAASALAAMALLIVLKVTDLNSGLENVQAILNSQYWLIVHVLLVVGSYGIFLLAALLGHWYFFSLYRNKIKDKTLSKLILQLLYIGLFMLIPGTILGGVWAAQSWGRFWDWDPKESWAFISACVYLIIIHSHRFNKIDDHGLVIGSIAGMLSISFTWYGVNYILGTGFHSYGFGQGGEEFYYLYILTELALITFFYVLAREERRASDAVKNRSLRGVYKI